MVFQAVPERFMTQTEDAGYGGDWRQCPLSNRRSTTFQFVSYTTNQPDERSPSRIVAKQFF